MKLPHWLKTVLLTSAGLWLITTKDTPYFLPSFATLWKLWRPLSSMLELLVSAGMYRCASSQNKAIGCLFSSCVHCCTEKISLVTKPVINGSMSEGTSEKSIILFPRVLLKSINFSTSFSSQSYSCKAELLLKRKFSLLSLCLLFNR